MNEEKETFLNKALEEMAVKAVHLEASRLYHFIKERDGACSHTLEELDAWLDAPGECDCISCRKERAISAQADAFAEQRSTSE